MTGPHPVPRRQVKHARHSWIPPDPCSRASRGSQLPWEQSPPHPRHPPEDASSPTPSAPPPPCHKPGLPQTPHCAERTSHTHSPVSVPLLLCLKCFPAARSQNPVPSSVKMPPKVLGGPAGGSQVDGARGWGRGLCRQSRRKWGAGWLGLGLNPSAIQFHYNDPLNRRCHGDVNRVSPHCAQQIFVNSI